MTETFVPKTKNFNIRKPVMVIIHGISTPLDRARDILSGRTEWEASAHYLITQAGEVDHYVEHTARSWHAGPAYWAGFEDINSMSIGIELQGSEELEDTDERFDIVHYSDVQMEKLTEILQKICAENKVLPHHILGHQDISPYRKKDPGPHFNWAKLAEKNIGAWHGLEKVGNDPIITDENKIKAFKEKLVFYGYDGRQSPEGRDFSDVIRAFQIHFLPWNICGLVTGQSIQALDILIKKKFNL